MLLSIALMLLIGLFFGWLCKQIRFPSLLGMIITGIILGPYVLKLIDSSILDISSDLRKIALIVILIRAGLSLNINDLKKVGRPAILMCFVPACFEIAGTVLLAPILLDIKLIDAAIMGSVIAAVSPAVIVPKMLMLMESGYGVKKGIPQLILAGASVDDVFVIVLFSTFTGFAKGSSLSVMKFVNIPVSIIVGIIVGFIAGYILSNYFKIFHIRDTVKIIIVLSIAFLFVAFENEYSDIVPFASLIGVMSLGISIQRNRKKVADRLAVKFNKLWVFAEVILFVLVGANVNLNSIKTTGFSVILLLFASLIIRMTGVFFCLLFTSLNIKERVFCMLAYTPKATVQAAIGGLPLAMGLECGNIVLTVSVLAILITAPLGAFMIDITYKRFLSK